MIEINIAGAEGVERGEGAVVFDVGVGEGTLEGTDAFFASSAAAAAAAGGGGGGAEGGGQRGGRGAPADARAAAARSKAELELMLVGDEAEGEERGGDGGERNYSLQALLKTQRDADKAARRLAKKGKGATALAAAAAAAAAAAHASASTAAAGAPAASAVDARFAAVLRNPEFSIDPTAPAFKDTPGMRAILKERVLQGASGGGGGSGAGGAGSHRPMTIVRSDTLRPSTAFEAARGGGEGGEGGEGGGQAPPSVAALAAAVKSKFGKVAGGRGK